jgi:hypothetical protein
VQTVVVRTASVPKGESVYRTKRIAGVALGVAILTSVLLGSGVLAQEPQGVTLQLTPSRDSGVSGTATLADVEGGVRVELNMRGLQEAGIEHINHLHEPGTCGEDRAGNPAPATIPLKTIVAKDDGTGSAVTTLEDVTVDEIFDPNKERYLAFHSEVREDPVPPVISCANVVRSANEGVAMTELPESGGIQPAVLVSIGAALILVATAGLLALWRRTT